MAFPHPDRRQRPPPVEPSPRRSLPLGALIDASDRLVQRSRLLQERAHQLSRRIADLNDQCRRHLGG